MAAKLRHNRRAHNQINQKETNKIHIFRIFIVNMKSIWSLQCLYLVPARFVTWPEDVRLDGRIKLKITCDRQVLDAIKLLIWLQCTVKEIFV